MAPTYGYGLSHQFGNRDPLLPNRIPVRLAVGGGRQAYLPETRLYQEMAPSQSSGALLGQNCHFSDMPTNRGAWAGTVRPETPPSFRNRVLQHGLRAAVRQVYADASLVRAAMPI